MTAEFLGRARENYAACNAATLNWMLDRPLLRGRFLNTKQNSITLADYGRDDGLRGPDFLYGWIQGRGLEAIATHADFLEREEPGLARRLDGAGRTLYEALDGLNRRHGHAFFCYDRELQPVIAGRDGSVGPQTAPGGIFTFSDIFVRKGLVAAAARYAPADLPRQTAALLAVAQAIEGRRFLIDERGPLDEAALAAQPDDYSPRMIMLGAAGLLQRLGLGHQADFAVPFMAWVLDRHFDPQTGLLHDIPGGGQCNVGHGIEFVGFCAEFLEAEEGVDPGLVERLERVLLASFEAGFVGPGLCLTVSATSLAPASPYCPWWSLPETVRAAALIHERTASRETLGVWKAADAAFFRHYWRGDPPLAYQTMTAEGPADHVPATPDLDPGYHTGLSLLAAIRAADRIAAGI